MKDLCVVVVIKRKIKRRQMADAFGFVIIAKENSMIRITE